MENSLPHYPGDVHQRFACLAAGDLRVTDARGASRCQDVNRQPSFPRFFPSTRCGFQGFSQVFSEVFLINPVTMTTNAMTWIQSHGNWLSSCSIRSNNLNMVKPRKTGESWWILVNPGSLWRCLRWRYDMVCNGLRWLRACWSHNNHCWY